MGIESMNRWTLLILLWGCVYVVFQYGKVNDAKIENLKMQIVNTNLDTKIKKLQLKYLEGDK